MARDYSSRLSNLRNRRMAFDSTSSTTLAEAMNKSFRSESYETRTSNSASKYALGAMQEVDQDYTLVGLGEAERVGKQLESGLAAEGISVEFDLQGSVPLNIHIRGASDVDLLALAAGWFTYDSQGAKANQYYSTGGSVLDSMRQLRSRSEDVLSTRFWGADVDKSGNKSIKMSGGSLKRTIDVVPSHWHNTVAFQAGGNKHDREVKVYEKDNHKTLSNMPFLHMKRINDGDLITGSGLKKAIRLCKNVKKDAENDGKAINMSSYDIASAMWYCDANTLRHSSWSELTILSATQSHLEFLLNNRNYAMALNTPDGSRKIFETVEKFNGLIALSLEVTALSEDVAREVAVGIKSYGSGTRDELRKALNSAVIY